MAKLLARIWKVLKLLLAAYGLLFIVGVTFFFLPTNGCDNINPWARAEMRRAAMEWGQLAPFPSDAKDFQVWTEGNMFARSFRGSFQDTAEAVSSWMDASRGIREGVTEVQSDGSLMIELKMKDAAYGKVNVSADRTHVTFHVAKS